MDRRKIRKQLSRKIELESTIIKSKDQILGINLNELNVKPSSTKSGAGGTAYDFGNQKSPKYSISATNLKIKKAHATTLSDFFSQQKDEILGIKKKEKNPPLKPLNRQVRTSDNKQPRDYLKSKKNDLLSQNPMSFYHRNSNAIVQHILKMSENSVIHGLSRNQSSQNNSQFAPIVQDDIIQIDIKSHLNSQPNSALRKPGLLNPLSKTSSSFQLNPTQLNQFKNLAALTQQKQSVHFSEEEIKQQQDQNQTKSQTLYQNQIQNQIQNQQQKNKEFGSTLGSLDQWKKSSFQRDLPSQESQILPATRSNMSQRMNSTYQSKIFTKQREEIINPKKFYCLSSVGFKNYKYPRPVEMPYERESEKRTRMPLYLLPQSAPSKEIEDICIGKYQNEVQELEQSIVDKQQQMLQSTVAQSQMFQESQQNQNNANYDNNGNINNTNNNLANTETENTANNNTNNNYADYYIQDLQDMKQKYMNEIGYIQGKVSSLSKKKRFKTNAKYTFCDSKSKDLNQIGMRSNLIEDISDTLSRNKNKIEFQMAKTKANLSRLQQEHSSFIQNSMSQQNKQQINQTIQQLYKDLILQSDDLKQNHKYTEEYRQRLEEEDEEGVDENEYEEYNGEDDLGPNESESNMYNYKNKSTDLQVQRNSQQSGYIQEETEEEFQNEQYSQSKFAESQLQQQINAQEDYINKYIQNRQAQNNAKQASSAQFDEFHMQNPPSRPQYDDDEQYQEDLEEYQEEQQDIVNDQEQIQSQQQQQDEEEEEEDDQIKIHSLADFKNTQPLTDKDIIHKPQLGQLMMNILIETFTVLKYNRPAIRDRILLSFGLNPQDIFQSVPKSTFELFYLVLVSKTSTIDQNINFIIKFFKLDDEDEEEQILQDLKDKQKTNESKMKQQPNLIINKDEFKRILRLLTISIDEKAKEGDKSLYDYMIENLTLTEVIKPSEQVVDLQQFKAILAEGKINPKDIIDLICNLQ